MIKVEIEMVEVKVSTWGSGAWDWDSMEFGMPGLGVVRGLGVHTACRIWRSATVLSCQKGSRPKFLVRKNRP